MPDERLNQLQSVIVSLESVTPPIVPATVEFVDIAGLIEGASKGEGLGNKFLNHIRQVDAICHVIRCFSDPEIVKQRATSAKNDFEIIKTELDIADMEHPDAPPFSQKPILVALNVDEQDVVSSKQYEERYAKELGLEQGQVVAICAKVEAELAELSGEEQKEYLQALGTRESALDKLIQKAFKTLGLITFLTAGEKEVRAWTIKNGITASNAAGVIHTDFMGKFIKADVCDFNEFIKNKGWKNARELGKVRSEGRDYVVKDGDVIEFKIGS